MDHRYLQGAVIGTAMAVAAACAGADDGTANSGDALQVTTEGFHGARFRHHPPAVGGSSPATGGSTATGGSATSGGTTGSGGTQASGGTSSGGAAPVSCSVCTTAQACCDAIGDPCMFR